MSERPLIVVSAINVFQAGPLSIVQDFLAALIDWNRRNGDGCRIVFFAHAASLYPGVAEGGVEILEVPSSRRSWFHRLWFEYVWFARWSKRRSVHTWISMHDMTPRVTARKRAVYCHHATPFYSGPSSRSTREFRFALQRRLYSLFYRINLRRNDLVIVQQQWLRDAFAARFELSPAKIAVARPSIESVHPPAAPVLSRSAETVFFYPSFPRFFKNFETVLEAFSRLRGLPARLILTFSGDENAYAAAMAEKARAIEGVELAGFLSREEAFRIYQRCHAVIFASRLESFGVPLAEAQVFGKPVFAADLPYAHEALHGYSKTALFDPDDAEGLARLLRAFCERREFPATTPRVAYREPYASSWPELIELLVAGGALPSSGRQATQAAPK